MKEGIELLNFAKSIIDKATAEGVTLRLLGGLAVYIHSPNGSKVKSLERPYKDVDFVVNRKGVKALDNVFKNFGLTKDKQFNALHGETRLLYYKETEFQIDVFIGVFEQCHRLDLERRLNLHPYAISLADTFLTKIQIHQMNEKDVKDLLALLFDHDFGLHEKEEISEFEYILKLLSSDWGWYTTTTDNLKVLKGFVKDYLSGSDQIRVSEVIDYMLLKIEQSPKTIGWKLRNIIGRRFQWYDEPEEVHI